MNRVMRTITAHDYKRYAVSAAPVAPPPGKFMIEEAAHPTSVEVNKEFSWHVVAHARDGAVRNPAAGYLYQAGPADSITIVRKDGVEFSLSKGSVAVVYAKGDQPVCTRVDTRAVLRGAKYPTAGTYDIFLISGVLTDAEAAIGAMSIAPPLYELIVPRARMVGIPVTVVVAPAVTGLMIGMPIITGLAIYFAMKK